MIYLYNLKVFVINLRFTSFNRITSKNKLKKMLKFTIALELYETKKRWSLILVIALFILKVVNLLLYFNRILALAFCSNAS